jgi:hypothetical protein
MGLFLGGLYTRALIANALAAPLPAATSSADPHPDFARTAAFSGLTNPNSIGVASNGRVFIAAKSGLIKVFDDLHVTTPQVIADQRTGVPNFVGQGLLGLELDPSWATNLRTSMSEAFRADQRERPDTGSLSEIR